MKCVGREIKTSAAVRDSCQSVETIMESRNHLRPAEPVKESFICPHCRQVLIDAVQTENGDRLCRECCNAIKRCVVELAMVANIICLIQSTILKLCMSLHGI